VNKALPRILSLVLALSIELGCDRNTEDFVEGEKPRSPDLSRIFPDSDRATGPAGVAPAMPRRGAPPVTAVASSSGDTISGTIRVSQALQASLQVEEATLFVIARPVGVSAGPPLAVLRIPSPAFPLPFEIGPANVMIPSMRFEGDIVITARLDGDSNAMTKLPGDLSGATEEPIRPGATGVAIVLDQKL
jgi:hypothetical protein